MVALVYGKASRASVWRALGGPDEITTHPPNRQRAPVALYSMDKARMFLDCWHVLPSRTLRVGLWPHRNPNLDGGPTHRLRVNQDGSVQQPDALLHAGEAETAALQGGVEVESPA